MTTAWFTTTIKQERTILKSQKSLRAAGHGKSHRRMADYKNGADMNLSENVRTLSKELKVSMAEIARRTGQSPQNLSKKLNKETLTFEDFEHILKCLGVEMEVSFYLPGNQTLSGQANDNILREQMEILEMQLEVERKKSRYMTNLGFEFRTALDAINGGINLAKNHSNDAKKVEEYLNRILPAMSNLMKLVEDTPFNRELIGEKNEEAKAADIEKLKGKRILLVEDNELNRSLAKELLEDVGIQIVEAVDGVGAINRVIENESGYFDYILMDLQMPNMDGFGATKAIRTLADEKKASLPIIAMTARVTGEDRNAAREAGMNAYLEKPLDINKLVNKLKEL